MIVWLASYPRSGNTFFRLVLRQVFGLPTYSVYDEFGVDDRQVELVGGATAENVDDLRARPESCIVKTHELPGDDVYPAIYLVRDGRDAIVSYATYIRSMQLQPAGKESNAEDERQIHQLMRDLIEHEHSFGGWGPHVERWLARSPAPVVIKFDDLIANPTEVVADAMRKAGAPLFKGDDSRLPSFEALRRDMPQFFRTGRSGSYRAHMPVDLQALFAAKYGDMNRRLGFDQ